MIQLPDNSIAQRKNRGELLDRPQAMCRLTGWVWNPILPEKVGVRNGLFIIVEISNTEAIWAL